MTAFCNLFVCRSVTWFIDIPRRYPMEETKDRKKASAPAALDPKKVFGRSPDQRNGVHMKNKMNNLPSPYTNLDNIHLTPFSSLAIG